MRYAIANSYVLNTCAMLPKRLVTRWYRATEHGPVQGRGVNSVQLYWDGVRWWIASATWDDERPDNPIPAELR